MISHGNFVSVICLENILPMKNSKKLLNLHSELKATKVLKDSFLFKIPNVV